MGVLSLAELALKELMKKKLSSESYHDFWVRMTSGGLNIAIVDAMNKAGFSEEDAKKRDEVQSGLALGATNMHECIIS